MKQALKITVLIVLCMVGMYLIKEPTPDYKPHTCAYDGDWSRHSK